MNARLDESYAAASELRESDQTAMADLMDAFRANLQDGQHPAFSDAEMAEIRAMEHTPDEAADPQEVATLFARNGV